MQMLALEEEAESWRTYQQTMRTWLNRLLAATGSSDSAVQAHASPVRQRGESFIARTLQSPFTGSSPNGRSMHAGRALGDVFGEDERDMSEAVDSITRTREALNAPSRVSIDRRATAVVRHQEQLVAELGSLETSVNMVCLLAARLYVLSMVPFCMHAFAQTQSLCVRAWRVNVHPQHTHAQPSQCVLFKCVCILFLHSGTASNQAHVAHATLNHIRDSISKPRIHVRKSCSFVV